MYVKAVAVDWSGVAALLLLPSPFRLRRSTIFDHTLRCHLTEDDFLLFRVVVDIDAAGCVIECCWTVRVDIEDDGEEEEDRVRFDGTNAWTKVY
jgi:hypothetical protein